MKTLVLLLAIVTSRAYAQEISNFDSIASKLGINTSEGKCKTSRGDLSKIEGDDFTNYFKNDKYAADWSCLELKSHLSTDSVKGCNPDPDAVSKLVVKSPLDISGKETYKMGKLGFFKGVGFNRRYQYHVAQEGDQIGITVRIHFTSDLMTDANFRSQVQWQLDKAADHWTDQSPGKKVVFHFLSVGADENPDYTVEIKPHLKGDLFDTRWDLDLFKGKDGDPSAKYALDAATHTIAHELGHMMGITDEYDPVRDTLWKVKNDFDTRQCNIRGLMCNDHAQTIYPYYYYLILRRATCATQAKPKVSTEDSTAPEQNIPAN